MGAEALEVGRPVPFDGKGEICFAAAGVTVEDADTTLDDKRFEVADVAFL